MTIDFWDRFKALLNQRLRKQNEIFQIFIEKFFFAFSIFDWVKPWIGLNNQLSNFAISFVYIWSTLKKKSFAENVWMCVCVCVCVCVCKLSIFCRAITRKSLHRLLWNFAWLYVMVYVFSRTLLILAMICRKLALLGYIVVFA